MGTARFFDDEGMDFAVRCVLSGVRHGMAEVGEVFAVSETIADGDAGSWLEAYLSLGRRLRVEADESAAAGHRESAWNRSLRAANYLFAGLWWAPSAGRADEVTTLWEEHRGAWDLAVDHWPTPAWPIRIPYLDTTLPGYWFRAPTDRTDGAADGDAEPPRPTVILFQGLDTPMSDACMTGMDGALSRGYHVLLLDGPGQGAALHRQGLTLVADWAPVYEAAVSWARTRPEVDVDRLVLIGVNHGAYFAASAVAHGATPPAAMVVDPGVVDLGVEARGAVEQAGGDESQLAPLRGTTLLPTGADSFDVALRVLDGCRIDPAQLSDRLGAARCPTLVVRAEDATSFAGQAATLLAAVPDAQVLHLTHAEGAGADCGICASQIHDAHVFDWLDDHLTGRTP